jgi:hypothetical protein
LLYVPFEWARHVRIFHSLPRTTPTPIRHPVTWSIEMAIPLSLLSHFAGPVDTTPGSVWHANLYKCGGARRYQHWASWSPLGEELDFHMPRFFGNLIFAE